MIGGGAAAIGAENAVVDDNPSDGTGTGTKGTTAWFADVANPDTSSEDFVVFAICSEATTTNTTSFAEVNGTAGNETPNRATDAKPVSPLIP